MFLYHQNLGCFNRRPSCIDQPVDSQFFQTNRVDRKAGHDQTKTAQLGAYWVVIVLLAVKGSPGVTVHLGGKDKLARINRRKQPFNLRLCNMR